MNTISLPTVELSVKRPGGTYMFSTNLTQTNKPELCDSLSRFRKFLAQVNPSFSEDSDPAMVSLVRRLRESGVTGLKKDEIINLVISIGSDLNNILNMARAVSPAYIKLWKRLITRDTIGIVEAKQILGFQPYVHIFSSWRSLLVYDIMLAPAGCNIIRQSYWDDKDIKIEFWLPQYVRKKAAETLFGADELRPVTIKDLPAGEDLFVESFEATMPRVFTYLSSLDKATPLLAGGTSAINSAKIKSAAKKLNSLNFGVDATSHPLDRNQILVLAFMAMLNHNEMSKANISAMSLKSFARFMVKGLMANFPTSAYHHIMPALKGFTKKLTDTSRAELIAAQVRRLIGKADGAWLDMSNFRLRYMCEDNLMRSTSAYTALFNPDMWLRANVHEENGSTRYGNTSEPELWEDVTWRFIVSYLRMLEAAGILEIAYATNATSAQDIDGIRYVRYTPLGRYAIGATDSYKPVVDPELADRFDVDSDNMIITILNENSPYRTLFGQISDSIGLQRYKFSAATLVRDIRDKGEVAERIQSLRDVVCPDTDGEWKLLWSKTGPWAEMFAEAELRANSRLPIRGKYTMIRLNPETPGLLDFILKTPEIATNTIKAEQSILLIPNSFIERFHKLANAAGYYL